MHEIICPHCAKAFKIDEAGYANILKQVHDSEFEQQLHERLELAEKDKRNAIELAQAKIASEMQRAATIKDVEIQELKTKLDGEEVARKLAVAEALSLVERDRDALSNELEQAKNEKQTASQLAEVRLANELQRTASTKDAEIQELRAKLAGEEMARKLAVAEALSIVEKDRDALSNELEQAKNDKQTASQLAEAKLANELQRTTTTKDAEIQALKAKLDAIEVSQRLAITEAVGAVEKERDDLKGSVARAELEKQLAEKSLKDKYETQIKDRDDAIERLRDMKARLSTKMVGETLEQHCETEFNRIRATAFPRAYFEKDND